MKKVQEIAQNSALVHPCLTAHHTAPTAVLRWPAPARRLRVRVAEAGAARGQQERRLRRQHRGCEESEWCTRGAGHPGQGEAAPQGGGTRARECGAELGPQFLLRKRTLVGRGR